MPTTADTKLTLTPDLVHHGATPLFAVYPAPPGPELHRNPLILALPRVKSDDEWLEQLAGEPLFDESQRQDEAYIRSYYVSSLKTLLLPSERGRHFARRFDQILRMGMQRNPLKGDYFLRLQEDYAKAQLKSKATKQVFGKSAPICTMSLIGFSGMGKTTTCEAVLAAYPQYIFHKDLDLHQVVWLKVECPKDGSVKELALNILRAFDAVLGTSHVPKNTVRVTPDILLDRILRLAQEHFLGALVLDEMQNLSVRKSGGREELLNWFQGLVNVLKLPVFILGTFKALKVLQLDARHNRRAGIFGSAIWRPLERGAEFDLLIETLWYYQWLREPGELTEEFKDMVYHETQGVVAFIVDMFLVCQLHALAHGKETITPQMFQQVVRSEFEFLQPLLNALRSKQPSRIAKFEDADAYDVDEIIYKQQLLIPAAGPSNPGGKPGSSLVGRAVANVSLSMGLSADEARRLVESVLTASHKSAGKLTEDALAAYFRARDGLGPNTHGEDARKSPTVDDGASNADAS